MDTNKDPVPTMEQQDVLIRWSEKVLNEENRFDPNAFGTVTSIGTVFGKPAVLKAVYCLDNSFADLRVDIGGEDPENSRVRIFIMFKAMQGIQVFLNYGDVADDNLLIKIDMSRNSKSLPPYAMPTLLDYLKEVVA